MQRVGGAAAYIALVAYNAATIGIFGTLAYFASSVLETLWGLHIPWQVCGAAAFLIVGVLSYVAVMASARVLGAALAAEVLILLVFDIAALARKGFGAFSWHVFAPSTVFSPGFGVSLMLAFGSFVGFEATAPYGEESRNPRRTVPRATSYSLALITIFYLVTSWAAISAYGTDQAEAAAGADPAGFVFEANAANVGGFTTDLMMVLVVTSLFAALLVFHCNTARYHLVLARDGLLPHVLTRTHRRHGSPFAASASQLGLLAAVVIAFTAAGEDPYLALGVSLFGLGVVGIVLLQDIAAAAIVGFFWHCRRGCSRPGSRPFGAGGRDWSL